MTRSPGHAPGRVARSVVAASLGLSLLAGCGSASAPSPPAGVDGLVVPTPEPAPGDFATVVDNPWFPVPDGADWAYDAAVGDGYLTQAADDEEVQGVPASRLLTYYEAAVDARVTSSVDLVAQDRDGNVWWFGHDGPDGAWRAGEDGAEAGLLMAATPRLGDGYVAARTPEGDVLAEVVALDVSVEVEAGSYDDVVVVDETAPDGTATRAYYARGVGLVRRTSSTGEPLLELVRHQRP